MKSTFLRRLDLEGPVNGIVDLESSKKCKLMGKELQKMLTSAGLINSSKGKVLGSNNKEVITQERKKLFGLNVLFGLAIGHDCHHFSHFIKRLQQFSLCFCH